MPKLVQKCGYICNGSAAKYMRYIATREGVENFMAGVLSHSLRKNSSKDCSRIIQIPKNYSSTVITAPLPPLATPLN